MNALREVLPVVDGVITIQVPPGFKARQVEVIVLDVDELPDATHRAGRRPSPALAGTRILGDIMAPAVAAQDWDALA